VASGAPPEEGSLRDFRVLSSFDAQHPTFATVTARLAYAGTNILVYLDTLAPPAGFSSSQLQAFARLLDQTLYPLDLSTFGPPSDIDQNGRVVVLLSPVVNALTPTAECSGGFVAGFFMGTDLGSTNDANSNHGEIFYSLVPDPSGSVGCAVSTGDVLRIAPPVFLHELQHLISFSQHVVAHGGQPEDGWLDEGLSRVAEELGSRYYEARFPPPTGRAAPGQIVPDSALPFLLPLLLDSYRYLERTDTVTLTLHSDSDFGLAWRGGVWLLMRWLGDQKGDAAFYKRLEQTKLTGIANIEAAAGERFPVLFGDFSTALWTDSLPGVARSAIPARNRFVSRNLRQLYDALYRTVGFGYGVSSPSPIELTALPASGPLAGSMVPGTAAFYQFDTPAGARTVTLQFTAPGGVPLAAKLHPQLSIFRLQ
jgi:hypothetical protein